MTEYNKAIELLQKRVSFYLMDKASENRILGFETEYSLDDVRNAVDIAILKINQGGVYDLGYTIVTCPEYLMLLGVSRFLMGALVSLKTRNSVDARAGLDREANLALYIRLHADISREFELLLDNTRNTANLMSAMY
jgi:hypothetical protein